MSRSPVKEPGDRGSGSVLVVALAGVALAVLVAGLVLGGVVGARHRAEAAADLAALAGASAVQEGLPACARAVAVAAANGAEASCVLTGEEVEVVATVPLPPSGARVTGHDSAVARARAGPPRVSG